MWNLINNNYICNEKDILRVHKIHLENLLNKKSYLNNKGPEIPYFLKNKLSLKELIRSNQSRINNDNHIMYKKLMHMANNPSPYSKFTNMPKYCPALDKLRFNYSKIERDNNIFFIVHLLNTIYFLIDIIIYIHFFSIIIYFI